MVACPSVPHPFDQEFRIRKRLPRFVYPTINIRCPPSGFPAGYGIAPRLGSKFSCRVIENPTGNPSARLVLSRSMVSLACSGTARYCSSWYSSEQERHSFVGSVANLVPWSV